jgi:ring-1,2-phenylacetyl-CoA epoxidase subunit PaaB
VGSPGHGSLRGQRSPAGLTVGDTQWPRFQVFKQDRADLPFENVGSVHAPDAEMALQNARDVFVRRPECAGLWVVPAEAIHAGSDPTSVDGEAEPQDTAGTIEPFLVFVKREQAGTHIQCGAVEASDPAQALSLARSGLDDPDRPGIVWWVFPERAVLRSEPGSAESMFGPARDKPYRQPAYYKTESLMRAIKDKRRQEKDGKD